jgi:hypothetical protein
MVQVFPVRFAGWLSLAAVLASSSANSAETLPTVTLTPTEISLSRVSVTEPAQIEVTIRAADKELNDIVLTTFSNDRITATLLEGEAKVTKLGPYAAYAWRLKVMQPHAIILSPAKLHVRIAYDVLDSANTRTHGFAYSDLTILPSTEPKPLELASVEIKGTLPSLSHERVGTLFVIINNKYSRPITVRKIDRDTPNFIKLDPQLSAPGQSATVSPPFSIPVGEGRIIAYTVTVPDRVVPGTYAAVVSVRVETDDGLTATAIASKDVEVSVVGDALLSLIGVPSFLVLPGFLLIISWRILWSLGKTEEQRAKFSLQATSADFWAIAILLSLVSAALYPVLTRLIVGTERNYLISYGFSDFFYVFAFALAIGLLSYLVWRLCVSAYQRYQMRALAKITPSETDDPLMLLDKLAKYKCTIVFQQAKPKEGNEEQRVLVLTPWRDATHVWVAPPVIIEQIDTHDSVGANKLQEIEERKIDNAAEIAPLVRQQVKSGKWKVYWGRSSGLRREEATALIELRDKAPLIEMG